MMYRRSQVTRSGMGATRSRKKSLGSDRRGSVSHRHHVRPPSASRSGVRLCQLSSRLSPLTTMICDVSSAAVSEWAACSKWRRTAPTTRFPSPGVAVTCSGRYCFTTSKAVHGTWQPLQPLHARLTASSTFHPSTTFPLTTPISLHPSDPPTSDRRLTAKQPCHGTKTHPTFVRFV